MTLAATWGRGPPAGEQKPGGHLCDSAPPRPLPRLPSLAGSSADALALIRERPPAFPLRDLSHSVLAPQLGPEARGLEVPEDKADLAAAAYV